MNSITNKKISNIKQISNLANIVLLNRAIIFKKATNNSTRILANIFNTFLEL